MKSLAFLLMGLCMASVPAQAQTTFVVDTTSTLTINGTSTIHNWTAQVHQIEGEVTLDAAFLDEAFPPEGAAITEAQIRIPVNSIDGGRGETMNGKLRQAFNETQHPEIVFALDQATVDAAQADAGTFTLTSAGTLTMAGSSQPIELTLEGRKLDDGRFRFSGVHPLKMTDFGMEPPTAMFGQIEAGDDVTVSFDLIVAPPTSS